MNKTAVILAVVLGVCLVSALNSCKHDPIGIPGCTDAAACNYNPQATTDDGSCDFVSCSGIPSPMTVHAFLKSLGMIVTETLWA